MTATSTFACSKDMAQLCRRTWGCSLLACSDGQCCAAAAAWMATRRSMASGLSRLPVLVGNSGSHARPARSAIQARSTC